MLQSSWPCFERVAGRVVDMGESCVALRPWLLLCCLLGAERGDALRAARLRAPLALWPRASVTLAATAATAAPGRGKYQRCAFTNCRRKAGESGFCAEHATSDSIDAPTGGALPEQSHEPSPLPLATAPLVIATSQVAKPLHEPSHEPLHELSAEAAEEEKVEAEAEHVGTRTGRELALAAPTDVSAEVQGTDMELFFLGTGSCLPTVTRGVACTVIRMDGSFWMFDAGEATQIQLQRSLVRPGSIDRIFITHLHGDHAYGLPGVLCLIGNARSADQPPLELYGPAGLRLFVRTALAISRARAIPRYVVHELHDIPFLHGQYAREPLPVRVTCPPHAPFEQPGDNIFPESVILPDGSEVMQWCLIDEEAVAVRAAPVQHSVPCVGYVVRESDRPGRLRVEEVLPRLEQNRALLREEGVRDPRSLLKHVKALLPGEAFPLPDGSEITAEEALEPVQRGRKIVILGDTCDASPCAHLALNADVVVHEATNTYMREFDGPNERAFDKATFVHGHSTPAVAGAFAASVNARALMLTHFSQRHPPASKRGIRRIEDNARTTLPADCAVVAAHDLSRAFVSRSKSGPALQFFPAPDEPDAAVLEEGENSLLVPTPEERVLARQMGKSRSQAMPKMVPVGRGRGGGGDWRGGDDRARRSYR